MLPAAQQHHAAALPAASGGRCSSGGGVRACAFSADGQAVTACTANGQLVKWDLSNLQHPTSALLSQSHSQAITDLAVVPGGSQDGCLLASCR
jgi:WD40 repeat protein